MGGLVEVYDGLTFQSSLKVTTSKQEHQMLGQACECVLSVVWWSNACSKCVCVCVCVCVSTGTARFSVNSFLVVFSLTISGCVCLCVSFFWWLRLDGWMVFVVVGEMLCFDNGIHCCGLCHYARLQSNMLSGYVFCMLLQAGRERFPTCTVQCCLSV